MMAPAPDSGIERNASTAAAGRLQSVESRSASTVTYPSCDATARATYCRSPTLERSVMNGGRNNAVP